MPSTIRLSLATLEHIDRLIDSIPNETTQTVKSLIEVLSRNPEAGEHLGTLAEKYANLGPDGENPLATPGRPSLIALEHFDPNGLANPEDIIAVTRLYTLFDALSFFPRLAHPAQFKQLETTYGPEAVSIYYLCLYTRMLPRKFSEEKDKIRKSIRSHLRVSRIQIDGNTYEI